MEGVLGKNCAARDIKLFNVELVFDKYSNYLVNFTKTSFAYSHPKVSKRPAAFYKF